MLLKKFDRWRASRSCMIRAGGRRELPNGILDLGRVFEKFWIHSWYTWKISIEWLNEYVDIQELQAYAMMFW